MLLPYASVLLRILRAVWRLPFSYRWYIMGWLERMLFRIATFLFCQKSSFFENLPSIVFTPPSVPPFVGDRNLRSEGENRPTRCSEPLRSKVGGPKRSSPCCSGWDRLGTTVNSLQFIFGGFDDKLQIYCEFLGILEYAHWHNPINGLCWLVYYLELFLYEQ